MIYLNNAGTSWPKPDAVHEAAREEFVQGDEGDAGVGTVEQPRSIRGRAGLHDLALGGLLDDAVVALQRRGHAPPVHTRDAGVAYPCPSWTRTHARTHARVTNL